MSFNIQTFNNSPYKHTQRSFSVNMSPNVSHNILEGSNSVAAVQCADEQRTELIYLFIL